MKFQTLLHRSILIASVATAQTFPITGPPNGVDPNTGARPSRQDITVFQNSGAAWDLYVQSLQAFMQTDSSEMLSYFQVAGIHGYPNIPWDSVNGTAGSDGVGYCAHNTVTFPTWHRPYMALVEQLIWQNAQTIAQTYPDSIRDEYIAAAQTIRLPYWDWSMDSNIPSIANVTTIQINSPNGPQTIDNPLYSYTFPLAAAQYDGLQNEKSTARGPFAHQWLSSMVKGMHTGTYNLFANQPLYDAFANAAFLPPNGHHFHGPNPSNSLENLHNQIHNRVGGQMADLRVAAFDPLFWLHHVNVDRIFAIWEALYPDQFTVPWNATQSDFVILGGTTVNATTPLYPFHRDDLDTLFTSNDVRSTQPFGYTYPEITDWGVNSDPAILKSNVTAIVNQLYNPTGSSATRRGNFKRATSLSAANAASYNWVIGVAADKSLLNQTLNLYFFLSTPPTDPQVWGAIPSTIGTNSIIVSRPTNSTPPASRQYISGQIFITPTLLSHLNSITPTSETVSFLTSNLQWRASYADGRVVDVNDMLSLSAVNVTLIGQTVAQTPELDRFPIYGDWVVYGGGPLGGNGESVL